MIDTRDPQRINRIIEQLRAAWHTVPDQRLGQLINNLLHIDHSPLPAWLVEDDIAERKLAAFLAGGFDAAQRIK